MRQGNRTRATLYFMGTSAALFCALAFSSCTPASHDGSPDVKPSATVSRTGSEADNRVETLVLDFDSQPRELDLTESYDYNNGIGPGIIRKCFKDCAPPCPCEFDLAPNSFDVDDQSRTWLLDPANQRLVVLRGQEIELERHLGRAVYAISDVQVAEPTGYLLGQDSQFRAKLYISPPRGAMKQGLVLHEDVQLEPGRNLVVSDRGVAIPAFEPFPSEKEVIAFVTFGDTAPFNATLVDRWPTDAGNLSIDVDVDAPAIDIALESPTAVWKTSLNLRYRFRGKDRKGSASAEFVAGRESGVHLLIYAGIERPTPRDAYLYVNISPNGEVLKNHPIKDPAGPIDEHQDRHLTLGPDEQPLLMFAMTKGVEIYSLAD